MHQSTPTTNPIDVDGSQELHRYGAEAARVAHNHEVTGSKPVAGIYHSQIYKNLPRCHHSTLFHRRGAEAARAAHNRKDIRSKRIVGILHSQVYKNLPRCHYSNNKKLAVQLDVKQARVVVNLLLPSSSWRR